MKRRFVTINCPAEGCGPPAGVKPYDSRTFANAVTASTNRQSTSNRIRTRSQEKLTTRLLTSQSPFLVPILKTVNAASRSVRSLSHVHTRKGAIASVAATLVLPLTGCYNLLIVNVGFGNKNAATLAAPLDPTVACAALASHSIILNAPATEARDKAQVELTAQPETCVEIIKAQQKKKEAKP